MPLDRASLATTLPRRQFFGLGGAAALGSVLCSTPQADAEISAKSPAAQTGNGEWTYKTVPGWGHLPPGKVFGGTHGAIVTDNAGNLYVSTQSDTGVLVYDGEGRLLRNIATAYPEIHSMVHAEEGGQEFFYATVQKGTPQENWLFIKMKLDGTVVQKITAPAEAGFKTPNEWKLTAAVPGPDGSIYIANGYGDSRIFKFDKDGNYKMAFAGKGDADGKCNSCHGMSMDLRYGQPLLLVCDRENRRLSHYDFDGKFVANLTHHLRRPCQVSFMGDYVVVSELEGRVTILDKDNVPVAFLGDNPQHNQWSNYEVKPEQIAPAVFSAAHGCYIDRDANIYVSDWNQSGRVTKLVRSKT